MNFVDITIGKARSPELTPGNIMEVRRYLELKAILKNK